MVLKMRRLLGKTCQKLASEDSKSMDEGAERKISFRGKIKVDVTLNISLNQERTCLASLTLNMSTLKFDICYHISHAHAHTHTSYM